MDVLDSMISNGVSLARSVELTAQWDKILSIEPMHPVALDDLHAVEGSGLGDFRRVVHHRLSDFIHGIVVHRRNEAKLPSPPGNKQRDPHHSSNETSRAPNINVWTKRNSRH